MVNLGPDACFRRLNPRCRNVTDAASTTPTRDIEDFRRRLRLKSKGFAYEPRRRLPVGAACHRAEDDRSLAASMLLTQA